MDPPPDLDRALGALYGAFSRYPLPAKTDACEHCVSAERVRAARAAPLRMLSASALEPYAWNGLYTWGDVEEFKHYLPRLLELLILEELDGVHARSLMLRLGVRWQNWRRIERDTVVAAVGAWWRHTLNHYPRDVDVMTMIETIAADLKLDLAPYLTEWEPNTTEAAARHMAWLMHDFTVAVAQDAEWYVLLDRWIRGTAPAAILERAFFSASSPEVAQELSDALETHRVWSRH
ncbi:hypothetical protein ABZ860_00910 [Microbispora sp. NPDC046973]|uniref:hypothetical protein n=1 Tax=Microbispora sp. NPDC046973 TaxID=3155022 RepID=UPI0033DEC8C2